MTESVDWNKILKEKAFEDWSFNYLMKKIWGHNLTTAQLRNFLLFECASNVFRALLEEAGPVHTLEVIKPLGHLYGHNIANVMKDRFGVQGTDVEAVSLPYYYGWCGSSNGNIKPLEIRAGKAVAEVYSCPTVAAGSPPELCAMSHFNSEGVCQAINPEYEYIWTHHLNDGDRCCRFIVKKRSERLGPSGMEAKTSRFLIFNTPSGIDNEELGELEKTIQLDISQEERDLTCLGIAFNYFNMFTIASIQTIGSERTMRLNEPLARRTGIKLGTRWKDEAGGGEGLETLKEELVFLQTVLNQKGEPAMMTDSSIEREIVECPFEGALPEQCKHLEGVCKGICEVISPEYEFAYDRMMSRGDATCHWTVRKKDVDLHKQGESALEILKKRFAKGEITKEAYNEMKALID